MSGDFQHALFVCCCFFCRGSIWAVGRFCVERMWIYFSSATVFAYWSLSKCKFLVETIIKHEIVVCVWLTKECFRLYLDFGLQWSTRNIPFFRQIFLASITKFRTSLLDIFPLDNWACFYCGRRICRVFECLSLSTFIY